VKNFKVHDDQNWDIIAKLQGKIDNLQGLNKKLDGSENIIQRLGDEPNNSDDIINF